MTKEQLAEEYADIHMEKFDLTNSTHLPYFHNDRHKIENAFEAGFDAAQKLMWISVGEQEPPHNVELLVKTPSGSIHLASWRPSYNIFTCQNKSESSYDWQWLEIPQ